MRTVAVAAMLAWGAVAWGAPARGKFDGSFQSDLGRVTLRQAGNDVTGDVIARGQVVAIAGKIKKNALAGTFKWPDGSVQQFTATISGDVLTLKIKGGASYTLRRAGGQVAGTVDDDAPAPKPVAPAKPAPAATTAAPAGAAASGALYKSDGEGWQFRVPKGWKHGLQGGKVLVGSDTEAGAIIAFYQDGLTMAQMEQQARAGIQEQGVSLSPTAAPVRFSIHGMPALAVELSGVAGDGSQLRARAIGVVGASGAAVFVGITTPEKYPNLRNRTDQTAQSVSFFKPSAGTMARVLVGEYWHYKGSGSTGGDGHYSGYSSERWLSLCANGTFVYRTQSDVSVNTSGGSATSYGSGGGTGRWSAAGANGAGTLRLAFSDGTVQAAKFRVTEMCRGSGVACDLEVDGRWFGRDSKMNSCR
jgi:hypothetical protein